jgi:thermitase
MMRPRLTQTSAFIRLVCLLVCYSLVTPLPAFTLRSVPTARAAAPAKSPVNTKNIPLKANQVEQKARWRDGELLVRFHEHAPVSKLNQLIRANGAQWNGQLRGQSNIEKLRLTAGLDPETVAATFRTSALVDFAEPNYVITADQTSTQSVPNDPRFSEQVALKSTVSSQDWGITTGAKQTVIAVIDSGIDFTHPDLRQNEWGNTLEKANNLDNDGNGFTSDLHGWDFLTNSSAIMDERGHGTAVAGIIAAQGNNATGITGVMWRASLMSLRVLDSSGAGDVAHTVEAIDYAVNNGAQVINCSWGTDDESLALREAINRAAQHGVLVVTSAGNNSRDIETTLRYPASFDLPNLISVASTDNADQLTSFSNWGMTHVSIAAPGKDILTTKLGGDYEAISGSSASTAFVTGVAGLIKTLRPWLGADRTRELIIRGARPIPTMADKVASKGVVSAEGVLEILNTLPSNEGLDEGIGYNGGEHGNDGNGRSNQRDNRPGAHNRNNNNGNRRRDGHEFNVAPPARTQGSPGTGLPDLDLLKRQQPTNPKAAPPIPSTRCAHHNPQCDKGKHQSAIDALTDLLALYSDTLSPVDPQQLLPINLLAWNNSFKLPDFLASDTHSGVISDSAPVLNLAQSAQIKAVNNSGFYLVPQSSPGAENVNWTNIVGVTPSGNNLSKPSGTGWDTGASSIQAITSGDGYVEFTTSESNTYRMCGLSNGDSNQSYVDIDFAIYPAADGYVYIYQSGNYVGQFGTYGAGDRFRVLVESGVVKYYKNGILFYTSGVTPTYPLLVDTSLYSTGATIINAVIYSSSASNSFSMERIDPINRTGIEGVDLLSRNANWSLPIVGLKGRAGLDLDLALNYNSLVWMKSQNGASIKFDADRGFPGPGFRLGFPVIQPRYYNSQVGVNAYLLMTPSGDHIELRQVGTSNTYESADSSYLQLKENVDGSLTLRPTDGSQLTYQLKSGEYRCTQIEDRNGNYISVSYYNDGRINTVTDTLARVITFNYDAYLNLISITQTLGGVTHTWATFGWSNLTLSTSFSGMTVVGPQNGSVIPVLTQVGLDDGSRYNFEYNSYAQVYLVRHYAADNHQRSYTSYTLPASSSDCPRVTNQYDWVENWNNNQEAMTAYSTAGDYSSGQATMPDSTIYKELFATSGWSKGLTTGTEFWSGGVKKKWTTAFYMQDDTNLGYKKNPRVTETNIYDSDNNRKRTTIDYGAYWQWGLPNLTREYAADGVTEIRHTFHDYNLSQAYLDQRIIGLVSAIHVSNTAQWQTKIVYSYDATGDQLQATQPGATQHDANYGTGMTARGNVTSISRYDVNDINNANSALTTRIGYDTDGSIIFSRDPLNHQASFSYADSFSDNITRNTFAYPTTITDPDNFSSIAKYNYDLGLVTQTQTPPPAGQTQGAIQTFEYDATGRLSKVNNINNGAYRRWVYDPSGYVSTFDTIQSGSPEAYSVTVYDGAGRVRATGGDNPNSVGGYRGQFTLYDVMGRVSQTSNPAEINGGWVPVNDDAAGWVWTQQAYDWKGRPTTTTNPDGTTKLATYGGCGCAGGEVVTLRDEVGRYQRMTADVLGRAWKSEVLNWDGTTVYSTTVNNYNARNQITSTVEQVGSSGTSQTTNLTYDGYGRLKTQQAPSQTVYTQYIYNQDDTVQNVTDGRGAVTAFGYNNRHLVTSISYSVPSGSNIPVPSTVTFSYDAVGNRTSMSDGSGSVTYQYDQLSRMTSETRQFNGLSGSYPLSYSYNLGGELTSITDPTGASISYGYDQTGRMTGISGSSFGGVTNYASNIQYRAWGALKSLSYGNSKTLSIGYNNLLQATSYEVPGILKKSSQYYNDGRLRFTQDQLITNSKFDRFYDYDHAGRVITALSGAEARGQGTTDDRPYNETLTYDPMNHLTQIDGRNWDKPSGTGPDTYVNDRRQGWIYDEDGRLLSGSTGFFYYDASGKVYSFGDGDPFMTDQQMDADGHRTKSVLRSYDAGTNQWTTQSTTYYLTSSVLGGAVATELTAQGAKQKTFVYSGANVLASQTVSGGTQAVQWAHNDASGASFRTTDVSGQTAGDAAELDAMGADAGLYKPFVWNPPNKEGKLRPYLGFGDINEPGGGCTLDKMPFPCDRLENMKEAGAVANETLIMNPDGHLGRHQDVIESHGVGVFTTHKLYIDGKTKEPASERIFAQQNPTPCEKYLATLFGDEEAYFADVDDGDPVDLTVAGGLNGGRRPPQELERHVHLYGSENDATKTTNVYIPAGGKILPVVGKLDKPNNPYVGRTKDGDATYMLVYFSQLGSLRNVTLAIFHIADFTRDKQKDGRTRVGTLGDKKEGGSWTFMQDGKYTTGKHVHLDLWQGRYSSLPARERRPSIRAKFSGICPPSLR